MADLFAYTRRVGTEEEVVQEDRLPCASVHCPSVCVTLANSPLVKGSHVAKGIEGGDYTGRPAIYEEPLRFFWCLYDHMDLHGWVLIRCNFDYR